MTCLPPLAANAVPMSPLSASMASTSAANAHPQPTLTYAVLAAARSHACSQMAEAPHSRKRQGVAMALTHLMLMLEVADADRA